MRQINIHEAKTHLSRLVEEAANGNGFIIAKSGRPIARVVPLEKPTVDVSKRIGFLKGKYELPDNFDEVFKQMDREIAEMFLGNRDSSQNVEIKE